MTRLCRMWQLVLYGVAGLTAAAAVSAQTQNVTPVPAAFSVGQSQPVVFDVSYTTSNGDNTVTGLGLWMLWDSTQLTFASLANVLSNDLVAAGAPESDTGDLDGDAATDMRVAVAWTSLTGSWPNTSLPVRLFTASFTTGAGFAGVTSINFAASSTAAGYSLAAASVTVNAQAASGPNLTPVLPDSLVGVWSAPIVVSTTMGTTLDSSGLQSWNSLYVDWIVMNTGNETAVPTFSYDLYVDNVFRNRWTALNSLVPESGHYVLDYSIGSLPNGAHTIKIVADATNAVAESNEGDNEYTKTICVGGNCGGTSGFYTLTPCRVIDTRWANGPLGGPILGGGGAERMFQATGACGIPSDAKAISVNVTVTQMGANGSLLLWPGDGAAPTASTVSFTDEWALANNGMVKLSGSGNGTFKVKNGSAAPVHFILDVNGYFK